MGVLDGVKVLDLSRVMAGPYCSMLLADMGAEVIKIEPPQGDDARRNLPIINGESPYFINLNRNKYGIVLNLKREDGKEVFRKLVKQSDIVLENFRPGVMEKYGLDYENLKKINPAIIYGCISGFGQNGPYRDRPGYDLVGQAMSGLMSVTGWEDSPPTRSGVAISDIVGGLSCCIGILAAYTKRLTTGIGDKVDISLTDGIVSSLMVVNSIYLNTGRVPTRIGNHYESVAPYETFPAQDGDVVIGCGNDKMFYALRDALDIPELYDEKYRLNADRVRLRGELFDLISSWTKERTTEEINDFLLENKVPSAPIYTIDQVVQDPQIGEARNMFVDCSHPVLGHMKITNSHLRFTNEETTIRMTAPSLGQHTEKILREKLNMTEKEIQKLKAEQAIG